MADRKISDLTALTTPASGDYLPIVDISEAAAASKNKRITIEELMRGVPDGTAAAPGIAFETDPNTGIYRPGADQLAVATNGTGRLFINSTGLVGIGTSTPSQLLTLVSASNPIQRLQRTGLPDGNGSDGGIIEFANSTGAVAEFRCGGDGDLQINTKALSTNTYNNSLFIKGSTGNVGIGTTSPTAPLTVIGADNSTQVVIGGSTGSTGRGLRIATALNGSNNETVIFDAQATTASPAFKWQLGGSDKMALDQNGRLLIGTSTSRGNLFNGTGNDTNFQLEGTTYGGSSASFIRNSNTSGQSYLVLGKTRGTAVGGTTVVNASDSLGTISFQGSDGTELVEAASITTLVDGTPGTNDMPGRLVFSTTADGASSPTERLRITSTGQVRLAGAGITFNGDTATANELDDYEEGTCLATTGTWTDYGSTYTKIGRMVYIEIRGDVATTPQAIALPFTFSDVCIGGYVIETTTFNGITSGVNASAAGTTITLPVGFIKGFLSYRAA